MTAKLHNVALTEVEIAHITGLLSDNEREGCYWGYSEQYWKRHKRILEKLEKVVSGVQKRGTPETQREAR